MIEDDWTLIVSSNVPVEEDVLYNDFNLANILDGEKLLRLRVYDAEGNYHEDYGYLEVKKFDLVEPLSNDIINPKDDLRIKIENLLNIPIDSFTVEYFIGGQYSSEGVVIDDQQNLEARLLANTIMGNGYLQLNIRIWHDGLFEEVYNGIYADNTLRRGWPKRINWYFNEEESYYWAGYLEPVVSDVDGDGDMEIFVHAMGNPTKIYGFDEDGNELSGWPVEVQVDDSGHGGLPRVSIGSPAIADIDNDGDKEIVVNGRDHLYFYNYEGSINREITLNLVSQPNTETVLIDLDNDGDLEIIRKHSEVYSGQETAVFDIAGNVLPGWPKETYNIIGPNGFGFLCISGRDSTPALGNFYIYP